MQETKTCSTCRFYQPHPIREGFGYCIAENLWPSNQLVQESDYFCFSALGKSSWMPVKPATQPTAVVVTPPARLKNRDLAIILEFFFGIISVLGVGWIYSGKVGTGILLMVGLLAWNLLSIAIALTTNGLFLICTIPLDILTVTISTVMLNRYTKIYFVKSTNQS